jgi:hypothetical protein
MEDAYRVSNMRHALQLPINSPPYDVLLISGTLTLWHQEILQQKNAQLNQRTEGQSNLSGKPSNDLQDLFGHKEDPRDEAENPNEGLGRRGRRDRGLRGLS